METKLIQDAAAALRDTTVANRRRVHIDAEPSGFEVRTAKLIADEMQALGMQPVWLREGVAAGYILDTGKPGKTVALRADIDALPMPEDPNNLKGPKVAVSANEGVCHACGHDGHVAMLLSAAKILADSRDSLAGRILFLFESCEETGTHSTASLFADWIVREKADAIWGVHLYAMMPVGTVSVQAGPRMSGAGSFEIEVVGRGGHGSRPDQSVNPVLTAAEITAKLQSVVPLHIAPDEAGVVTVAGIQGGGIWNIIPDTCRLIGGIRYFSVPNYHKIVDRIRIVTDAICTANDCTATYLTMPSVAFPVVNHPELSKIAEAAVDRVLPGARREEPAWMASESFGRYQNVVPGVFAFVGIANEQLGSGAAHHNVKFDIDEEALHLGVQATVQFASDYLGQGTCL